MPNVKNYRKRARKGKKAVKAPNGAKVKLSKGEGLSRQEFTQIKKMLPRVETKMGPVGIFGVQSVPYQTSNDLPNIPIIGQSIAASVGFATGCDYIRLGAGDGQRIGSKINVRKLTSHIQWCIDDSKSSSDLDPGPYQIRWLVYKCKNTYNAMGEGGLPQAQNMNWKTMYDDGNDVYTPPQSNVTDMYRKINRAFYTVHKEGTFTLQTLTRKTQTDPSFSTSLVQPMLTPNGGALHHVYLDLTKFCAKTLKYIDDPAAFINQNCTNDSMYLTYTVCKYDNQPIIGNLYLNCTMVNTLYYTDS